MKQWQSDPIQGMQVYNMKRVNHVTTSHKPRFVAAKKLTRTYQHVVASMKPKKHNLGDGYLTHNDAVELLRRFK